ncbi:hypothetical protein T09_6111 [Trichinella sp. T9]|nr:hypothetical protein T09_6111 [Trichinella sp. T9]
MSFSKANKQIKKFNGLETATYTLQVSNDERMYNWSSIGSNLRQIKQMKHHFGMFEIKVTAIGKLYLGKDSAAFDGNNELEMPLSFSDISASNTFTLATGDPLLG